MRALLTNPPKKEFENWYFKFNLDMIEFCFDSWISSLLFHKHDKSKNTINLCLLYLSWLVSSDINKEPTSFSGRRRMTSHLMDKNWTMKYQPKRVADLIMLAETNSCGNFDCTIAKILMWLKNIKIIHHMLCESETLD